MIIIQSLKKRSSNSYRHIPLSNSLLNELKNYTSHKEGNANLWCFTRRTASRVMKKVMQRASITGSKACARGLRHSFAVHCIFNSVPINTVQKWMGHSSLSTTSIYLNIVGAEERKLAEKIWKI